MYFKNIKDAKAWLDNQLSGIETNFCIGDLYFAILLPESVSTTYDHPCQENGFGLLGKTIYNQFLIASLSKDMDSIQTVHILADHLLQKYKGGIIDNSKSGVLPRLIRKGDIVSYNKDPQWTRRVSLDT